MRAPLSILLAAAALSLPAAASAKCSLVVALTAANRCKQAPTGECLAQVRTMRQQCQAEADATPVDAGPTPAPAPSVDYEPLLGPDGRPLPPDQQPHYNPPSTTGNTAAPNAGTDTTSLSLTGGNARLAANLLQGAEQTIVTALAQQPSKDENKTPGPTAVKIPADQKGRTQAVAAAVRGGDFRTADAVAQQDLADGHPVEARAALDSILRANPNEPRALETRGSLRADAGDYAGALSDARAALKADPDDGLARELLGFAEAKLRPISGRLPPKLAFDAGGLEGGAPDGGSDVASRGAAAGSAAGRASSFAYARVDGPAREALAEARRYAALGDYARAQAAIDRALALNAKNADLLAERARILSRRGDFEGAIKDADAALSLDPRSVAALLERGFARYSLARYRDALADVEQALAIDPLNAMGHLYRAMILEKMDRAKEAVSEYIKAAELDASLKPIVDEALARLGLAASSPAGRAARRYWPIWIVAITAALALLGFGLKRVIKPEWATPVTPLR